LLVSHKDCLDNIVNNIPTQARILAWERSLEEVKLEWNLP